MRTLRALTGLLAGVMLLTACEPNRYVSGWIPFWSVNSGLASLNGEQAKLYSEVSLMWYEVDDAGAIVPFASLTTMRTTRDAIHAKGLPVLPSLFDGAAAGRTSALLADPARRAAHVQAIADLVVTNGFDGIDLDYEVFAFGDPRSTWPAITPNWVAFVRELGTALHGRGKLLSVTIPPVWVNGNGVLQGYTVYAQDQIAPFADRIRLMVYDWSVSSPGPISPISWVNQVITYSSTRVPPAKLQLGVPAYGRHWATQQVSTQICPDKATYRESVTMKETAALAASVSRTPARDASGELTFSWTRSVTGYRTTPLPAPPYVPPAVQISTLPKAAAVTGLQPAVRLRLPTGPVTCTVQHTVFVPDAVSLRQRADAAVAADWSGIIIWAMGYETTDSYGALAGVAPQRPNGNPTGAMDAPTAGSGSAKLTGWAVDPEFDLPVAVRLRLMIGTTVAAERTVTANVQRAGMAAGLGPFHGFEATLTAPAGTYQACATVVLWDSVAGPALPCQAVTIA